MHEWPDGPQLTGWVIPESLQNQRQGTNEVAPSELPAYAQPVQASHQPTGYPAQSQPAQSFPSQPYASYVGGSPGGVPPWMTVQQPKPRHGRLIAAVVCGLVVAIAGAGYLTVRNRDTVAGGAGSHTLRLPATTGSYVQVTTQTANQLGKDMTTRLKSATGKLWSKPVVGLYADDPASPPSLIFMGADAHSNPKMAAQLNTSSDQIIIDGFMTGAQVTDTTAFAAGPLGGSLRCGAVSVLTLCVWVDKSTIGSIMLTQPSTLADAAAVTKDFRQVAER